MNGGAEVQNRKSEFRAEVPHSTMNLSPRYRCGELFMSEDVLRRCVYKNRKLAIANMFNHRERQVDASALKCWGISVIVWKFNNNYLIFPRANTCRRLAIAPQGRVVPDVRFVLYSSAPILVFSVVATILSFFFFLIGKHSHRYTNCT